MIIVYILTDDPKSERVNTVKKIFSNKYFAISVVSVCPKKIIVNNNVTNNDVILHIDEKEQCQKASELEIEQYRIITSLNNAYMHHSKNNIILVKDTSISIADPDTIAKVISDLVKRDEYDVSYISKWNSRCDLYTNKEQVLSTGSMIVKTQLSEGFQCIMFTPHGRDIILGKQNMKNNQKFIVENQSDINNTLTKEIFNGNIEATCIVPNLINFDPTAAKSNEDYKKSQECKDPTDGQNNNTGTSSFLWILIIIIILVILIWGIYKLRNSYYGKS